VRVISLSWKLSAIEERHKEQTYFGEEITGTEVRNLRTVLGSIPSKHFTFRDISVV
jgi:hypothetical protein